jgi:hypothetical protein
MTRAAGVGANIEAKDDGSRMMMGFRFGTIDRGFFLGMEQGRLGAPESRLLASAYSTASFSH